MKELRPPGSLANLQRRVAAFGDEHGFPPDRIHQRVSSDIFMALLERAKEAGIVSGYLLKGGMGMELRFGLSARASGDIDIGIETPLNELVSVLDRILRLSFDDFTFERRGDAEMLQNVGTLRVTIGIRYRGSVYSKLKVDLNHSEYEPPIEQLSTGILHILGLRGPTSVPILHSHTQIAQKVHGATEPSTPTYSNRRYRDVIDVLIFAREESGINFTALRQTVLAEFKRRGKHSWPPTFSMPEAWHLPIAGEARDANFENTTWELLEQQFNAILAQIEGVNVKAQYEYKFLSLQLNIAGSGDAMTAKAQAELDQLVATGWRSLSIGQRPGYIDQLLAILERPLADEHQPFIDVTIRTDITDSGPLVVAQIRNVAAGTIATDVRVYVGGVGHIQEIVKTLVGGDPSIPLIERLDDKVAYRTYLKHVDHVIVEYADRFGHYYKQVGDLTQSATDGDVYTLSGNGLGRPIENDEAKLLPFSKLTAR